ncbi:MAG: hypothetical protein HYY26_01605 [Acidobacteria bacterium]|nr:hypothetical protein [Acidobacteriota bacterium]
MRNAIIDKLARHLSTPVDTECKAVYLLCEARKLFDSETLPALYMCANWALHVDLDSSRNRGARRLLQQVDAFVAEYLQHGYIPFPEPAIFKELLFIGSFRRELRAFLASLGLPTDLCDEHAHWFTFLEAYAGVIEDGSLVCKGEGFRHITKLVFTKGRTLSGADLPFTIDWEVALVRSGTLCASLHTNTTRGNALAWGLTLRPAAHLRRSVVRRGGN